MQERTLSSGVKVVSPAPRDEWQAHFQADAKAVPYQSPRWFESMLGAGGYKDVSRMYEFSDGRRYILPLACKKGIASCIASSMPHGWGMGGLLSKHEVTPEVTSAVFDDLAQSKHVKASVRPNPQFASVWANAAPARAVVTPRLAHMIDLAGGFDHVWSKGFSKVTRANVRKAERFGVQVECDTTGKLVPVFDQLLRLSIDRWAEQQHEPRWLAQWRGRRRDPADKFERIAKTMGSACKIWVAWFEGQPAAVIIVLLDGQNAQDIRGAIDKPLSSRSFANDLIQKLAIEDACQAGCRYYHMGESGGSQSLAYYKERFGAEPLEYADYAIEKLPLSKVDRSARSVVKSMIRFKDTQLAKT